MDRRKDAATRMDFATGWAVLKVDAVQHGDDHFLPGPTDIAWDLNPKMLEQIDAFFVNYQKVRSIEFKILRHANHQQANLIMQQAMKMNQKKAA
jgi:hypothetical protein